MAADPTASPDKICEHKRTFKIETKIILREKLV